LLHFDITISRLGHQKGNLNSVMAKHGKIVILINVNFKHGNLFVLCQNAGQNKDSNVIWLFSLSNSKQKSLLQVFFLIFYNNFHEHELFYKINNDNLTYDDRFSVATNISKWYTVMEQTKFSQQQLAHSDIQCHILIAHFTQ